MRIEARQVQIGKNNSQYDALQPTPREETSLETKLAFPEPVEAFDACSDQYTEEQESK